jgi:carbon monoxide dehydrogenase subunit G
MRLEHSADVPTGRDEVWRFVNDIPAVIGCVPGAQLTGSVDESTYRGLVRISVGPFSLAYQGSLRVIDSDDDLRTLRMQAQGLDRRGGGSAQAAITLALMAEGSGTSIRAAADVALSGPVASLGALTRAVSGRLFEQFADEMTNALEQKGPGHPTPAVGRRDSLQVAPMLWSVTRQRVTGYLRGLGRRRRP